MDPEIWGPKTWFFLHSITFNYPINPMPKDKENMLSFVLGISKILPCLQCRKHFEEYINQTNFVQAMESKESFVKWMIDAHNNVNRITNKKILSYKEVINIYEKAYKPKEKSTSNKKKYLGILVIAIIVALMFIMGCFQNA